MRLLRNGAPAEMLDRLEQLIDARIEHSRQSVERRVDRSAFAQDLGSYVEGKRLMDDLRFRVDQLAREQQRRIADVDVLGLSLPQTFWIYGRIPGRQPTVVPGVYADTISVTLTYY